MRPTRPISLHGTLLLNSLFPGAGQRRLGQREKGRWMLALYLVLAIPGAVVWLTSESLVVLVAMLPAAAVSWWSHVDLRRTLGVPLWPFWGPRSQLRERTQRPRHLLPERPASVGAREAERVVHGPRPAATPRRAR